TRAARPSEPTPRRCRRPRSAWPPCPTRPARPIGGTGPPRPRGPPAVVRRAAIRPARPVVTGRRAGRGSRSCALSAGRGPSRAPARRQVDPELPGHGRAQRRHGALVQPGEGQHQVELGFSVGGPPEGVQPTPYLGVLQLAQVSVDVEDGFVERGVLEPIVASWWLGHPEVAMDLGLDQQVPYLAPDGRK